MSKNKYRVHFLFVRKPRLTIFVGQATSHDDAALRAKFFASTANFSVRPIGMLVEDLIGAEYFRVKRGWVITKELPEELERFNVVPETGCQQSGS